MKSMRWSIFVFVLFLAAAAVGQESASCSSVPATAAKPHDCSCSAKSGSARLPITIYTVAHMYEDQFAVYNRSDLATKAIEEYRLAIDADPTSEYLTSGLAELYAKTGRIRDAVLEAQDILKKDPNNLEAHGLLGWIYLRLWEMSRGGTGL